MAILENNKSVFASHDERFRYMMLSRLMSDVLYFETAQHVKHLYFNDPRKHYNEMVNLWKTLPKKPVWLRAVDFKKYKHILLNK